ncbi:hypothetical protein FZ983_23705 [Azospirillum sp. B21]|uniref:hypothetical protein n=1 Tax=Azospirillum sp. B21 TaxID=2607496 RepID=UPI0011ED2055|nr:hypothetical protein [Azospirillum sp. B21]KAA0576080.1 hypothetical protein FZ983_23705 [Azospirillum sp. B21]
MMHDNSPDEAPHDEADAKRLSVSFNCDPNIPAGVYGEKRKKWQDSIESRRRKDIDLRAAFLFDPAVSVDTKHHDRLFPAVRAKRFVFPTVRATTGSFDLPPTEAFAIVPSEFLRKAGHHPPRNAQATASAFSQWIYSLYAKAYGDDEDRESGKEMEKHILEERLRAISCIDNAYLKRSGSDWRLVHNGLHMDDEQRGGYFSIGALSVRGEPLRASPDLVYQNQKTSEVLIVEIKYSRLRLPTNLWPNIWGQLWCYSQFDMAVDAPRVTVIGEVWGGWWLRGCRGKGRFRETYQEPILTLRASVRRDPRAPAYDRFFRRLFDIYRSA